VDRRFIGDVGSMGECFAAVLPDSPSDVLGLLFALIAACSNVVPSGMIVLEERWG
jgi:hypothetical protein